MSTAVDESQFGNAFVDCNLVASRVSVHQQCAALCSFCLDCDYAVSVQDTVVFKFMTSLYLQFENFDLK